MTILANDVVILIRSHRHVTHHSMRLVELRSTIPVLLAFGDFPFANRHLLFHETQFILTHQESSLLLMIDLSVFYFLRPVCSMNVSRISLNEKSITGESHHHGSCIVLRVRLVITVLPDKKQVFELLARRKLFFYFQISQSSESTP